MSDKTRILILIIMLFIVGRLVYAQVFRKDIIQCKELTVRKYGVVGSTVDKSEFPNTEFVVIRDYIVALPVSAAIIGQAKATAGSLEEFGAGVVGISQTDANYAAAGVAGWSLVGDSTDTADAVGVFGMSWSPHPGGPNVGVGCLASGGTVNYCFRAYQGDVLIEDGLTVGGEFSSNSGWKVKTTRLTGSTTLTIAHHIVYCDTDGGAFTVNLPAGIDGTEYKIVNTGTSSNDVTISPNGVELLNGFSTDELLHDSESMDLIYETTEGWWLQ